MQVGQGESQSTWPQDFTTEPVFESSFVFMISNPHVDDLHIKIIDSGHKNAVIGTTTIRTSDIMAQPDMEYSCQSFNLKGVTGKEVIKLAASVMCLSKAAPCQETLEDSKRKESMKKQSTVSEPLKKKSVINEAVVTEVPQEEVENKTNEDLVFAEQVSFLVCLLEKIYDKIIHASAVSSALHSGAFCQFPFLWIHYCHSRKSTGKETGKTHLCALQNQQFKSNFGVLG